MSHSIVRHQGRVRLHLGDSRDVLKTLDDSSIDSVACDPPYALVSVIQRFGADNAAPAKFGTDGLYARASAGFMGQKWDTGETAFAEEFWKEVFRVLKPGGHVVAFGGTRTYHHLAMAIELAGFEIRDQLAWTYGTGFPKSHPQDGGMGTALKPAWEPICLARKPLSEKTVEANVARWGTGAINVEGCRVRLADALLSAPGRFPANLLHDGSPEVLAAFPVTAPAKAGKRNAPKAAGVFGAYSGNDPDRMGHEDNGGSAARFFYAAKASKADREEGLEHLDLLEGKTRRNIHPTVKPTDVMRWLVRLITPPGGTVLDPFMGSGSTGKACMYEGMRFVGVDAQAEFLPIAEARIAFAADKMLPASAPAELDYEGY